jgi:hypothetical protein
MMGVKNEASGAMQPVVSLQSEYTEPHTSTVIEVRTQVLIEPGLSVLDKRINAMLALPVV